MFRARALAPLAFLLLTLACGSAGSFPDTGNGPVGACDNPPSTNMTFFVTENGSGTAGGNLGGLAGADATCDRAANAAGITGRTWRAYLSAENDASFGRVDARDRIGPGPWINHAGVAIPNNESIHTGDETMGPQPNQILSECGRQTGLQGEQLSLRERAHDVLTGSDEGGRLQPGETCNDWTSSGDDAVGSVGHVDTDFSDGTWNRAHATGGCSESAIINNLGVGQIYCFAVDGDPMTDAGVDDNGLPPEDAGVEDFGGPPPDTGPRDTGIGDTGVVDTGVMTNCGTPSPSMSFFFTHNGSGAAGGNLGGLTGADAICDAAAVAAGITGRAWRAYLSTLNDGTFGRVDARNRIGAGPWNNFDGTAIGNLAFIHHELGGTGIAANLMKSECGLELDPNGPSLFNRAHDILTGSDEFGQLFNPGTPYTCGDWLSSDPGFIAQVGHEDTDFSAGFWNSAHETQGCSEATFAPSLCIGRIYCFAL